MKLLEKSQPVPVPRGPMMTAAQVAAELYSGAVTPKWVLDNVPHKMKFGHRTVFYYRDDVLAYIESVRAA